MYIPIDPSYTYTNKASQYIKVHISLLIKLSLVEMKKKSESKSSDNNENVTNEPTSFRSPHSDVEVPKSRKRRSQLGMESTESLASKLDPLAVTKQNMSTSRRPNGKHERRHILRFVCIITLFFISPTSFLLVFRLGFHSTKIIRLATNFDSI